MRDSSVETLLGKDRAIVAAGLIAIVLLAWLYLLAGAGTGMSPTGMTSLQILDRAVVQMGGGTRWGASRWITTLSMWWVMMIAMMLPSAAPAVFALRACLQA